MVEEESIQILAEIRQALPNFGEILAPWSTTSFLLSQPLTNMFTREIAHQIL
jgi:hypothetical protein